MKNTLTDLNDHLFAQIERLGDEQISSKKLQFEEQRTKSLTSVAKEIISNARLALDAQTKIMDIPEQKELPAMLK